MSKTLRAMLCAAVAVQSFGLVGPVQAAPAAPPSENARACAVRYNTAMHMDDTMAGMMRGLMPVMIDQMEAGSGKALSASDKAAMVEAMAESASIMGPKLQDALIRAMVETFSEQEICAMAAFYESSEGQGVVAKMPAYSQATSSAVRDFMPAFQADMLVRICQRMGCDAAKMPTATPS